MAVIRWDPFPLEKIWPKTPWLFEDEEWSTLQDGLNVYETDDNLVVEAYVPGVSEKEIDISVEGGVLTIKAEHKEQEEEKKKKKVVYRRAMQARYLYTTNIPFPVKAEKAEARLNNGVLSVTLPKSEESKPKRIQIKAGR